MTKMHMAQPAVGLLVAGLALLTAGCDEKKPNLPPVASAVPKSTPPLAGASVKKFVIDPSSKASIDMEAPKEKIRAVATGGAGTLDVDLANVPRSRGEVKIDLTTLTTSSFAGKPDADANNKAQTTHARTWLEVADAEGGKLDDKVKEANRYAVYVIRSVSDASANDLAKVSPTKDGGDDVRAVQLITRGELLVHGHKVERDGDVELAFHYDPGAAPDKPKSLVVKTRKPFRVVLAEHDVKPRDAAGKIAKEAFHLLGTKVAENADVSLELRARPK